MSPTNGYLNYCHDEMLALLQHAPEWHAGRRKGMGGSDANVLMAGDPDAILDLWRVKRGEKEPEDLSGILPVIFGTVTEPLNRYWYTRQTGRAVANAGETRNHPDYSFMACTLDGTTLTAAAHPAIFEAKTVNAWSNIEEVEQRYWPQLYHNAAVCGLKHAVLSVFIGTLKWELVEVGIDDWYLAELIDRERAFWNTVETGQAPPGMEPVAAPVKVETFRTVDLTGSNEWASAAGDWLENQGSARVFASAEKSIKALVDADVGVAHGYGIQVKRSRNGALRISKEK